MPLMICSSTDPRLAEVHAERHHVDLAGVRIDYRFTRNAWNVQKVASHRGGFDRGSGPEAHQRREPEGQELGAPRAKLKQKAQESGAQCARPPLEDYEIIQRPRSYYRRGLAMTDARRPAWFWLVGSLPAAALIAAIVLARYGSALVLALTLAAPSVGPWLGFRGPAPALEPVEIVVRGGRTLQADLYRPPTTPSGALLLVHGLSPSGRRQPDLERLARALATDGQLVLVPEFAGLTAFRLSGREVDDVRSALLHLRALSPERTGVAGFSFGAGPALLAAATSPGLRLVGAFGGYADLRNVITFITTGVHYHEGQRHAVRQEEYNRWKLLALLLAFVEAERERMLLQTIADRKLANPADDTGAVETQLGQEGRTVFNLVTNRKEEAIPRLLGDLPPRVSHALDSLSPLVVMPRLAGRLLIAHGAGDESIPFTESLRLAAAGRTRAVILGTFHHVGPASPWPSPARVLDGARLVGLADRLLSP
jgi:hypothetical protein